MHLRNSLVRLPVSFVVLVCCPSCFPMQGPWAGGPGGTQRSVIPVLSVCGDLHAGPKGCARLCPALGKAPRVSRWLPAVFEWRAGG